MSCLFIIATPSGLQTVRGLGQASTVTPAGQIRGTTRIVRQRSPITPGAQVKVVGSASGSQPQIITIPAKPQQQQVRLSQVVNIHAYFFSASLERIPSFKIAKFIKHYSTY